jgi:hypothetical protein
LSVRNVKTRASSVDPVSARALSGDSINKTRKPNKQEDIFPNLDR